MTCFGNGATSETDGTFRWGRGVASIATERAAVGKILPSYREDNEHFHACSIDVRARRAAPSLAAALLSDSTNSEDQLERRKSLSTLRDRSRLCWHDVAGLSVLANWIRCPASS